MDDKLKKKRINKAKTTARRVAPIAVLVPGIGILTSYTVKYVSTPNHLYPLLQSADAKAKAKQEYQTARQIDQVAQSINKSATLLAALSSQSAANQSSVNSIDNGINKIRNTPIPTLGPLATPPKASNSNSYSAPAASVQSSQGGNSQQSAAAPTAQSAAPAPVVTAAPPIQLPAATTRPSQLG
ncbi:MAG: hypothetical protein M0019_02465 [Actinomycetota bacterium]|nr:hypothetical protein [Actinomycetota bacterium]